MNFTELAKSDAFFFITAIGVIILTVLLAVVVLYVIRILRNIERISKMAKLEALEMKQDLESLRETIRRDFQEVHSTPRRGSALLGIRDILYTGMDLFYKFSSKHTRAQKTYGKKTSNSKK
jgi:hypothetical protein